MHTPAICAGSWKVLECPQTMACRSLLQWFSRKLQSPRCSPRRKHCCPYVIYKILFPISFCFWGSWSRCLQLSRENFLLLSIIGSFLSSVTKSASWNCSKCQKTFPNESPIWTGSLYKSPPFLYKSEIVVLLLCEKYSFCILFCMHP